MNSKKKRIKWTKELCFEIALTCNTRKELSEKSRTCYTTSHKNAWLEEICAHMKTKKRALPNHWTKENCRSEASKYETRSEFEKSCLGAYTKARRKDWLDDICTHMHFRQRGVQGKKKLYLLKWIKEHKIYIGITNNPKRRINDHIKNSSNSVVKLLIQNRKLPVTEIVSDWLDFKEIVKAEQKSIDEFERLGWEVLNIAKGGALGGTTLKWTEEKCAKQALKYKTRGAFEENESGCYKAALRLGIYDEICGHMKFIKYPNGYWTKERCQNEALKYKARTKFSNCNGAAYNVCLRNNWLDEICSHMTTTRISTDYWTKEICQKEASKYKSKGNFNASSGSCYRTAKRKGWLEEICVHMKPPSKKIKWTIDKCKEEALKYKTRTNFQKGSRGAYKSSLRNGWLNELCKHMPTIKKPNGYWTKEKCRIEADKYATRIELFKNNSSVYNVSLKNKWLEEFYSIKNVW